MSNVIIAAFPRREGSGPDARRRPVAAGCEPRHREQERGGTPAPDQSLRDVRRRMQSLARRHDPARALTQLLDASRAAVAHLHGDIGGRGLDARDALIGAIARAEEALHG